MALMVANLLFLSYFILICIIVFAIFATVDVLEDIADAKLRYKLDRFRAPLDVSMTDFRAYSEHNSEAMLLIVRNLIEFRHIRNFYPENDITSH